MITLVNGSTCLALYCRQGFAEFHQNATRSACLIDEPPPINICLTSRTLRAILHFYFPSFIGPSLGMEHRGVDGSCAKHLTVESYVVIMPLTVTLVSYYY